MKLSKIIEKEDLYCATIHIYRKGIVVVELFYKSGQKNWKRTMRFSGIAVDVEVRELTINTVEHLGIVRYRDWNGGDGRYINIYNY